jgi:hypothetical protein
VNNTVVPTNSAVHPSGSLREVFQLWQRSDLRITMKKRQARDLHLSDKKLRAAIARAEKARETEEKKDQRLLIR